VEFDEFIGLLIIGVAVVAWLAVVDDPNARNVRRAVIATLAVL